MPENQKSSSFKQNMRAEWGKLPAKERRQQIRDLITSPWWDCLTLAQRERWLDQFQDLPQ